MSVETKLIALVPPGGLEVNDDPVAAENRHTIELHFEHEWHNDLDGIMATMVSDDPYQYVPSLGVEVRGPAAVRDFYKKRIEQWPGQAFKMSHVLIGRTAALFEGAFTVQPRGEFLGLTAGGHRVNVPGVISIHFRDGLIWGETLYFDAKEMTRQLLDGSHGRETV